MQPGRARVAALAILLASSGVALSRSTQPDDKVDINHASLAELEQVPGLTPAWAKRIIRFRPYRTKRDLVELGILPAIVYSHIRGEIVAHQKKD